MATTVGRWHQSCDKEPEDRGLHDRLRERELCHKQGGPERLRRLPGGGGGRSHNP